jgi:hypothetical protein
MTMTRARRDTSPAERVYLPREGLDRVPLFHARGEWRSVREEERDELRTRCGILVYQYVGDRGLLVDRTHLRLDHAESFAEPCRRCWPDLEIPF